MANSRLEKIGTIYTRTKGLLVSGAMKHVDRPVWYDVYEAFPPKDEPRFDRPAPNITLPTIFYKEDTIRATFHRNNKSVGTINMFNSRSKTLTQRFIESYQVLQKQYDGSVEEKQVYQEAIEMLRKERQSDDIPEQISLSTAFREAQDINKTTQPKENISISVKDIFKD